MSNGVCRPKKVDPNSSCRYCLEKGHWKKECPVLRGKFKSSTKAVRLASIYSCNERLCIGEISVGKQNAEEYVGNQTDYGPFVTTGFVSLVNCPGKVSVKILRDTGSSESFILDSKLKFSSESSTGNSVLIRGIGLEIFSAPLHKIQLESDLVNGEVEIALRPSLPVKGVDLILGNNLAGNRVWRAVTSPIVKETPTLSADSDMSARDFPDVFVSCAVTRAMSAKINVTQDKDELENLSFDPLANLSLLPPSISRDELIEAQGKDAGLTTLFTAVQSNDDIENAASGYFIKDGILVRKWTPYSDHALGEPIFQIVIPEALRGLVLKTAHGDVAGHLGVKKTYHSLMCYFFWPRLKRDVASFIKTCHTCQIVGKPNEVLSPAPLYPIPVMSTPFEHLTVDCVGPLSPSKAGSTYLLTVMCQATRYPAAYPLRKITTRAVVKALSQFISVFGIPKVVQTDRGTNFTSRMFAQVLQQLRVNHHKSTSYHPESQGSLERFHQTLKQLLKAYCNKLNKDWEEGLPWLMLAAREDVQESLGFSPNDLVFGHKVRGPLALLMNDAIETETPVNLLDYVNGFRRRLYLAGKLARENLGKTQLKMKTWFDRRSERRKFSPGDQVLMLLPVTGSSFLVRFTGPYSVLKRVSDQNYIVSTPDRRKATQLCHVNLLKPYFCRAHENAVSGTEIKPAALVTEVSTFSLDTPSCTDLIHHDIDVGNSLPVQQRFYRVSPDKQEILEAEVKYLLNAGLAKPSYSMEDCVDSVGSAKFVTKIDLLKGYYQVPLTPRAQEVSAFITPSGLYSYNVMSFGLRNAPATFQRLMNRVVTGLEGCAVYLDDVVVYSQTWDEHLRRLRALFVRLAKAKLTINLVKCEFVKATVTYLGRAVGQGEVCLIREKVHAVDRFSAPSTKKELMRFLGMIGYYHSFCANFSTVVAPLTDLLKSKRKFEWTANCQRAFDNAKLLLSTAPVLVAPRWDTAFQIQVDASRVGAGAVILQKDDDGVDRPVSFFSKKFNSYQLNYSTIEKETLALVWALQHFDVYIGGGSMPVFVFSDHNPLTFLQSLRSPNQRLIRWALLLQPYSLDIRHIRGRDNVMADALSRSPAD
ncbi:Retrovirus-related Pol polyprotein from transposon 17.6 [Labeo rohita]|uniref:Gypsy retrotransposon integrase-like protein 1 n=1 Tax=Labeo rohita TaxID=84645 RepID=A0ABQ8KZ55_LABRO|nr:Retrovirus-related Pol polyprotein from transposon 17.6 [Labeo rohita]